MGMEPNAPVDSLSSIDTAFTPRTDSVVGKCICNGALITKVASKYHEKSAQT